jgi:hypothetical protein
VARPWTADDIAQLKALTQNRLTIIEIAKRMDRSMPSIHNKQASLGIGSFRSFREGGSSAPDLSEKMAASDALLDKIPEWLDQLRPVALPAPAIPERRVEPNPYTLVAGDFHFPMASKDTIAILLETIVALRPQRLILNGDTVDLLAVSRYPKDQRHTWDLRQEVTAFHEFLHMVRSVSAAWNMEIVETEANHSGNGTASRWHRYLSDRVPVLYGHPKAQELLNYETWFYPEWCPIRLQDHALIADELLVIHGDMVRKHAAYSARGHAEKWHSSVMHSHTHRMGSSLERIPAVGLRPEQVRRAYEIGCMCDLNPSYVSAPNWTNGFAIVSHSGGVGSYGVELVNVVQGQASIVALGKTVRTQPV